MTRALRYTAVLALLGICLTAFSTPVILRAQGAENGAKEESPEPPHELLFKVINFAILAAGLGYILRKPMSSFFTSRSSSIQKSLDEGRKALEASQSQLRVVEDKLNGLEAEIAAFKSTALKEMEAERQRIQEAGVEESARILESARNQIAAAVRSAKLDLKRYAAQKSVDLAEEMIRNRMDDAGRERLVKQFVSTLDRGQNSKLEN